MTDILIQFMNCTTQEQVSTLVKRYGGNLPNPFNEKFFYSMARNARVRIARIRREKMKSYNLMLN